MGKITFILGGARSGKSAFALQCAKKYRKVAFIATAEARDSEMLSRIKLHKKARPAGWLTFEEPLDIAPLLEAHVKKLDAMIIDCLTIWISNLLLSGEKKIVVERQIAKVVTCLKQSKCDCYIVTNEVGLGIVPENKLARCFRDIAGRVNQVVAAGADEVFLLVAGVPLKIK